MTVQMQTNTITLKVGKNTDVIALKTSIVGYLKSGKIVSLDSIGVVPTYISNQAMIKSFAELNCWGIEVSKEVSFKIMHIEEPLEEGKREKTAIRWTLTPGTN